MEKSIGNLSSLFILWNGLGIPACDNGIPDQQIHKELEIRESKDNCNKRQVFIVRKSFGIQKIS